MEFRLWDYESDKSKIDSFLETASISHGLEKKDVAWFNWKYQDCPDGRSLLMCAFDDEIVIGCVAMRRGKIIVNGQIKTYGASYENFVHPAYRKQGIFVKLIAESEQVCRFEGMEFLICFPNSNSYSGYIKAGWTPKKNMCCRIGVLSPVKVLKNLQSLRKPFMCSQDHTNVLELSQKQFAAYATVRIEPIWNKDYLHWRFAKVNKTAYCYCDNEKFFAISRIGYRGNLKECQIITVQPYDKYAKREAFKDFIKYIESRVSPDIVSCNFSKHSDLATFTKWFIPVPTRVKFVYKILSTNNITPERMAMDAMFFHTY